MIYKYECLVKIYDIYINMSEYECMVKKGVLIPLKGRYELCNSISLAGAMGK